MSRWFTRFTTILLVVIAILLLGNFIVRTGYIRLSGEQFYYWLSPVISLFGFIAIIATLVVTRNDILNRASQPFYESYRKEIDDYVSNNKAIEDETFIMYLDNSKWMRRRITRLDKVNFYQTYEAFYDALTINMPDFSSDIKKLHEDKKIDTSKYSESTDYKLCLDYIKYFQHEIESFYEDFLYHVFAKIFQDRQITNHFKRLLYRYIKTEVLQDYILIRSGYIHLVYIDITNPVPEVKTFVTDRMLRLTYFIMSNPEIKKEFIPELLFPNIRYHAPIKKKYWYYK